MVKPKPSNTSTKACMRISLIASLHMLFLLLESFSVLNHNMLEERKGVTLRFELLNEVGFGKNRPEISSTSVICSSSTSSPVFLQDSSCH